MESQLAPMGELLDSLLLRLAQVEKVANSNNAGLSTSPTTVVLEPNINTTNDDATEAQIQSLQAEVEDLRAKLHETEEKLKQLEHEQGLREVLWRSAFQQVSNIALNASDFVRAMCKDSSPLDVQAQLDRVSVPTTSSIGLSNPIGV